MQEQSSKDLRWALGLNKWGAKLLGVWPIEAANHSIESKEPWHVYLRVPFIITLLLFWICLPQTWALVLDINNFSVVVNNLMSNAAAFSGSIKLFFLWHNKKVMQPVVQSARNDWLRAKSFWERELMLQHASGIRLVTAFDYTLTTLTVFGFVVFPLLNIDIRLKSNITDYADRHLLVQSYYPFDYSKTPYFELTMGLQYLGAFFTALATTVPESYFGALVMHTSGQFEILSLGFERCFDEPGPTNDEPRLPRLVQRHVHLVAIARTLEISFTYVILAQIFGTSIILCSYGFQFLAIIGASDQQVPVLQVITVLCVMVTLMIQTLLDCVVGETLATRIVSLCHSIYKCQWYKVTRNSARDLIPTMIISQNQKTLTAGKILPLSLKTYCSILKTTAGYISMLVAVNSK
ncbi:odorant receptor 13a-like isoform X2 [Phymastichus coffea]|uniref:odorant receptor 13a-like isoform X2 n=1 Tax=Phymastichus coffea TaxID=108790 RepID=UPI00273C8009|nr:odorant receptor 13a-like isoform X2 [Phymastichus coffea]